MERGRKGWQAENLYICMDGYRVKPHYKAPTQIDLRLCEGGK